MLFIFSVFAYHLFSINFSENTAVKKRKTYYDIDNTLQRSIQMFNLRNMYFKRAFNWFLTKLTLIMLPLFLAIGFCGYGLIMSIIALAKM